MIVCACSWDQWYRAVSQQASFPWIVWCGWSLVFLRQARSTFRGLLFIPECEMTVRHPTPLGGAEQLEATNSGQACSVSARRWMRKSRLRERSEIPRRTSADPSHERSV